MYVICHSIHHNADLFLCSEILRQSDITTFLLYSLRDPSSRGVNDTGDLRRRYTSLCSFLVQSPASPRESKTTGISRGQDGRFDGDERALWCLWIWIGCCTVRMNGEMRLVPLLLVVFLYGLSFVSACYTISVIWSTMPALERSHAVEDRLAVQAFMD